MNLHASSAEARRGVGIPLELELQVIGNHQTQALVPEYQSSIRAAGALSDRAISPAPVRFL